MVGITNVMLFMLATTRLPFAALHVGQGLTPSPRAMNSEWSTVCGTLAGKVFELRLRRELVKVSATGVAFLAGVVARVVGVAESVPE